MKINSPPALYCVLPCIPPTACTASALHSCIPCTLALVWPSSLSWTLQSLQLLAWLHACLSYQYSTGYHIYYGLLDILMNIAASVGLHQPLHHGGHEALHHLHSLLQLLQHTHHHKALFNVCNSQVHSCRMP